MDDIGVIFKRANILKFKDSYNVKVCVTMYKILYDNYAPFLYNALIGNVREHGHDTRTRANFLLPIPEIRNIKVNFLYLGINLWNNLDNELKELKSSNILKSRLKEKSLSNY